jgi:hypothetical protein
MLPHRFCQAAGRNREKESALSQANQPHPLEGGLVYQDLLPIAWEARPETEQAWELARAGEENEHLLRYANLLGEQHRERPDDETEGDNRLNRIESKVDLLVDLFSRLLEQNDAPMPVGQVRISGAGIEWLSPAPAPDQEDSIWIQLILDRRLPGKLRLPARVLAVAEEEGQFRITAGFQELGEGVQDLLEKIIFRHHRRQVAQSRPSTQER